MHSPVSDDRSLIDRFSAGDVGAFEEIVARNQGMVRGLAYKLLGRSADLDDVTQEVFAALFAQRKKLRGEARLKTWLTRVTVNHCRSKIRRAYVKRRWFRWMTSQAETSFEAEDGEASERRRAVRAAVFQLPEKWRTPISLRYFAGLSIEEIALAMNLRPGTVEVQLCRARNRLKEMLAEDV